MDVIKPPIFFLSEFDPPIHGYATMGAALARIEPWYLSEYAPVFLDSLGKRLEVVGSGPYTFRLNQAASAEPQRLCDELAQAIGQFAEEQAERTKLNVLFELYSILITQT
jgi:hypothetical protein